VVNEEARNIRVSVIGGRGEYFKKEHLKAYTSVVAPWWGYLCSYYFSRLEVIL
jgi:hypothetical protein